MIGGSRLVAAKARAFEYEVRVTSTRSTASASARRTRASSSPGTFGVEVEDRRAGAGQELLACLAHLRDVVARERARQVDLAGVDGGGERVVVRVGAELDLVERRRPPEVRVAGEAHEVRFTARVGDDERPGAEELAVALQHDAGVALRQHDVEARVRAAQAEPDAVAARLHRGRLGDDVGRGERIGGDRGRERRAVGEGDLRPHRRRQRGAAFLLAQRLGEEERLRRPVLGRQLEGRLEHLCQHHDGAELLGAARVSSPAAVSVPTRRTFFAASFFLPPPRCVSQTRPSATVSTMMVAAPDDPLAPFHPIVRAWFARRFGEPTDVQRRAWPAIARGEHVLATAPTGSGKTLAAFLWALDRLLAGAWEGGRVRVLYISPLKALNNDVERNLLTPLSELTSVWMASAGAPPAPVRVAVRSGDTPTADRRRMLRRPPEVLITTPESLNLLITTASGREMLGGVATVILDEVHAVAGTKRGTHLITAVDRLVRLAGEFQRVALSATVKPLPRIARFVGGWTRHGKGETASYRPRPVSVLEATTTKVYEMTVELPAQLQLEGGMPQEPDGGVSASGAQRPTSLRATGRRGGAPPGAREALPHPITNVPGFVPARNAARTSGARSSKRCASASARTARRSSSPTAGAWPRS